MINIGAYYVTSEGKDCDFNEYVMPYGKVRVFFKFRVENLSLKCEFISCQ